VVAVVAAGASLRWKMPVDIPPFFLILLFQEETFFWWNDGGCGGLSLSHHGQVIA
jgi:hypothetical protein